MAVDRKESRCSLSKKRSRPPVLTDQLITPIWSNPATPPPTHLKQDLLLTDFDLQRLTGRARSSWQKARLTGGGPPFIRLGRLVRYRMSEFNAWLAACPSRRSTSEAA
jgi:hypothetical protein